MPDIGTIIGIVVAVIVVILLIRCIVIVPQAYAYIVELLGKYHSTWNAGPHFRVPIFYKIKKRVSLKEQVADFEPQPVIRLAANAAASTTAVIFFFIFSSFCIFDAVGNKKDAPGEFPTRLCERKEIVFVYTLIRVLIFVKYGSNFPQKIRFQGSPAGKIRP